MCNGHKHLYFFNVLLASFNSSCGGLQAEKKNAVRHMVYIVAVQENQARVVEIKTRASLKTHFTEPL